MFYLIIVFLFFTWSLTLNYLSNHIILNKKPLFLFPYFECFTTLFFMLIWHNTCYFWPYFVLFSALSITILTDLSCMVISRFVSLYLAPSGILLSYLGYLPIYWIESIIASIIGYSFFYIINKVFYFFKKQDGLGQGDLDLMALIGAYTGMLGIWFTILFGSLIGTILSLMLIIQKGKHIHYLPFGPYLSLGAMLFVLFQSSIIKYML